MYWQRINDLTLCCNSGRGNFTLMAKPWWDLLLLRGANKKVPACCSEGVVKRRGLVAPLLSFRESSSRSSTHEAVGPQSVGPVAPTLHLRGSQLLHRPPQTVGRLEPLRPEGCRIWSTRSGARVTHRQLSRNW